jgi:2-polyprenyl-3-methyl-5-hydroxy-6-metoxy-1,4-benzoquinol methylase
VRGCVRCARSFEGDGWRCPACGFEPPSHGFRLFAPELADSSEGFDIGAFERLALVEPTSFWFRSRNRLVIQLLTKYFAQARSLLEVGCGTGFVLSGINDARSGLMLVGSDLHPAGLAFAQRRVPDAELYQMDARHIPFDSEFDVVLALDVIEHIQEDEAVLTEIFKAVKPGGGAIVSVPQHPRLWSANDDFSQHKRRYTRGELKSKLRNAGFEVRQVTSFVTTLLPLMLVSRMRQRDLATFDPSGEYRSPRVVDRVFEGLLETERWVIGKGASLPAGGSLFAVATKPA